MKGEADKETVWAWERYLRHLEAVAEAAREWCKAGAPAEYSAGIRLGAAVEELDALDKEE